MPVALFVGAGGRLEGPFPNAPLRFPAASVFVEDLGGATSFTVHVEGSFDEIVWDRLATAGPTTQAGTTLFCLATRFTPRFRVVLEPTAPINWTGAVRCALDVPDPSLEPDAVRTGQIPVSAGRQRALEEAAADVGQRLLPHPVWNVPFRPMTGLPGPLGG
jgi:hypothetical protein